MELCGSDRGKPDQGTDLLPGRPIRCTSQSIAAQGEMKENIPCMNCRRAFPGYRLVLPLTMTGSMITNRSSVARIVPG
jgi:hypothetical protein